MFQFRRQLRRATIPAATFALAAAAITAWPQANAAGLDKPVPAPALDEAASGASTETLILAGGCFWGVQGVFQHVHGVISAVSGYDGGDSGKARYETVSTGSTGHAEAVRIIYDPRIVTTGQLLRIFFSVATDPTQRDQQYPDIGPQYRSAIFTTSIGQTRVAQAYIAQLDAAGVFAKPIVTTVGDDTGFYPAENYHQNYLTQHPNSPYIATFDLPKIQALQASFPQHYRPDPVLVSGVRS